jgi:hypothetical protein
MPHITLPSEFKIVDASAGPVTTNGAITCDYVSLKNCVRAWIYIQIHAGTGFAHVIQPMRGTAVSNAGTTAITVAARIWSNETTAATDTLVRQTDATSYTTDANAVIKQVLIEIDPALWPATFDVLGCTISNSGHAADFASVSYFLEEKYQKATPPAAITD